MVVEIKVFASLRHHIPASKMRLEDNKWDIPEGTSVGEVLDILKIPKEEAKIVLINGRSAKMETILKEEDVLHIFPPMCGG